MSLKKKWSGVYRHYLFSVSLLTGTIIGAGIFSLPFSFKTAGLSSSLILLVILLWVNTLVHLMYADVIVRTEEEHRFPGYARAYLGKGAFNFGVLTTVISSLFVLTIYLVLSASFFNLLFDFGSDVIWIFIFWLLGSGAVLMRLKQLGLLEFLITLGMIVIIGAISLFGVKSGLGSLSLFGSADFNAILFPLAPIFFALGGRAAIPSIMQFFKRKSHNELFIRRSIIWGTAVPAVICFFFAVSVIRLSKVVSEDAVTGLAGGVPPWLLGIIGVLGLIAIYSSYVVSGVNIKDILRFDLKFSKVAQLLIVIALPILLYLIGLNQFLFLVGITGGILGVFEGALVVMMWKKMDKINPVKSRILKAGPLTIVLLSFVFIIILVNQLFLTFS
jgi:amino acid permease